MSPLDKKLLRDLSQMKGQILTISLVVAAGIAGYITMKSTWSSLMVSKTEFYERYRFADVFVRLKRAPSSVAHRIEEIPGVAVTYPRVVREVMLPVEGMIEPAMATLVSLPRHGEPPLNGVFLRSGRMPEPGRADEMVIAEAFASAHGLVSGDEVPAVLNGNRRKLRIVGIGLSPEFLFTAAATDFAPDDKRRTVMWMRREQLAPAFQMEGAFNDVALRLQPNASTEEVLRELDAILEPYGGLGAVPRARQLSNFILEGEMTQLESFSTSFPLIFLLVAAFLLNVVLSRLVNLQRQQIAVLKAVGYRNRRIAAHYLELVAVIAVIGSLLGVVMGAWFGSGMTTLYAGYFRFPSFGYRLDAPVIAMGILVSVAAAVVGALAALRQVVKLPPAEAMRPPAPTSYKTSLLDRLGLGKLIGHSAMMVVREIRRRPLRMILSSLGIAAAVGVLVVGRFGYDSFEFLLYTVFHEEQRGDMSVALIEPLPAPALGTLRHLPGVLDAEGMRAVPVRFRAGHRYRDSVVFGMPDKPRLRRIIERDATEVTLPSEGIAVSRKLGEILDVGVGNAVDIEIREGNRKVQTMTVTLLVDDAFGLQGYMPTSKLHRVLGQELAISLVHLRVDPTRQNELHQRLKQMPMVAQVTRVRDMVERFNEQSGEMMLTMTLIMTFFAGTIAIGVVYNNARIALSLRSRDLASLRVLGFSRREISAVLLGELAVQLVLAIPLGLWLGTEWAKGIMSAVDPEVYRLPIVVSPQSYAFAVVVTVGAGIISALLVRRKLDKLDLIAVLKTRE